MSWFVLRGGFCLVLEVVVALVVVGVLLLPFVLVGGYVWCGLEGC